MQTHIGAHRCVQVHEARNQQSDILKKYHQERNKLVDSHVLQLLRFLLHLWDILQREHLIHGSTAALQLLLHRIFIS